MHCKTLMREGWIRISLLLIAPVVVAAGFFARPFVADFTDDELMAAAISAHTRQWEIAGLLMVAGAILLALAFPAAVSHLGGTQRWVAWVRTAITVAAALLALQVGLASLGAAAVSRMGADVVAFREVGSSLEIGILMVGLLALAVAWAGTIWAVWATGQPAWMKWMVTLGGALGALGHLYPGSPGEYTASVGTAAALWTIAAYRSRAGTDAATRPGQ